MALKKRPAVFHWCGTALQGPGRGAAPAVPLQDGGLSPAASGRWRRGVSPGYLPAMEQWPTILTVLLSAAALLLGIWKIVRGETQVLRGEIAALGERLDRRLDHLNDRLDRHLEGHAPKVPQA